MKPLLLKLLKRRKILQGLGLSAFSFALLSQNTQVRAAKGALIDDIRNAMTSGGNLYLQLGPELKGKSPALIDVFLRRINNETIEVNSVDFNPPGESAKLLWLPWKQGELTQLQRFSIERADPETLFLTFYLTGCKVFAIKDGPVWHIDAPVSVTEFWPRIEKDEWVEDNWAKGTEKSVAYLHRAGQGQDLWDLSQYLTGNPPNTYSCGDVGEALVGGIVKDENNSKYIDLYFSTTPSPWESMGYNNQRRN